MEITVRDVRPEDTAWIMDLNEVNVEVLSPLDAAKYQLFLDRSDLFLVAEADGEPAGFLVALREGVPEYRSENYIWFGQEYETFLYVDRIVLDERFRGRGIGRAFYDRVFQRAADTGVSTVTAEVDIIPYNEPSLKLHEAMGLREVGQQVIRGGAIRVPLKATVPPSSMLFIRTTVTP